MEPTIVGAGLAGLIAAHAWPHARIVEAGAAPERAHHALLRFRSDAVANLTGIEFRRVLVRKGVWVGSDFVAPSIRWANSYAQKVLPAGALRGDRSIWALEPAERFVAPDDLYARLLDAVGSRVDWRTQANYSRRDLLISTAPLPVVLAEVGLAAPEFGRAPIHVQRWRVPGADAYQTVYYPEPHLGVYRASLTGDILIVEGMTPVDEDDMQAVQASFALQWRGDLCPLGAVEQRYGKIVPIDDTLRKQLLFTLTHEHNIYSLGRFATWRNLLLDDVVADIAGLKRLMRGGSAYNLKLEVAR